ncbi:uncharacterized protein N7496_007184 [Penicillium cataractarum]|uniref:Cytochrome P450 n=1 Tax=Penicillium cataractarum TaxID=2100454 RepID=A0A9W9S2Y3_9EURO|nr:uncharacterized protein N7496_007184 [Penicillium cataractarum]KAJ5371092.1 hypothetical protein N7496_007184 [Penicillium cataractarum]
MNIKKKIELCVSKIHRDAMAGRADILMWFTFMATDVIGQLCFGESFDMLSHEVKNEYVHDLEAVMMISGIRAELSLLMKLATILPIPKLWFIMNGQQRMHNYGKKALEPLYNSPSDASSQLNIFTMMLATKSNTLTQYDIEEEATSLIIAGSDTTAVTTTYIIWAIIKHPEVKDKTAYRDLSTTA